MEFEFDPEKSRTRRPGHEQRRVNVDFPLWMVELLDRQVKRMGVTRQSVIKLWIAERLQDEKFKASSSKSLRRRAAIHRGAGTREKAKGPHEEKR
jgi:hypothetical protein